MAGTIVLTTPGAWAEQLSAVISAAGELIVAGQSVDHEIAQAAEIERLLLKSYEHWNDLAGFALLGIEASIFRCLRMAVGRSNRGD